MLGRSGRRRRAAQNAVSSWVAERVGRETDRRIQIWLRIALGGERLTVVAESYGYRDASGVHRVVERLEQKCAADRALARRLARYRAGLSNVER